MSSPPPTPSPPPPLATIAPPATMVGTSSLPVTVTSTAPVPTIFTPKEVTGALRDLATVVQGIRLYLVRPYGPPAATPPAAATGPLLLPWHPSWAPASTALAGPLQHQLQLQPPRPTTCPGHSGRR
ncbi:hypothetical protein D1007_24231 [Hordeum vulgare]|nr:hypothetical protein D1007_24231 [Hordeum vulgare]